MVRQAPQAEVKPPSWCPRCPADRLAELGADVWAAALGLANSRLTAEREALEQTRAKHEAAQAEATGLADKLAAEVEALQTRLASIEAAEQAARAERDQALQEASKAREEAARLAGQCEALQVQAAAILARLVPQAEADAETIKRIETERARTVSLANLKRGTEKPEVETFPHREEAKTRDKVATAVGLGSGKTYEKAAKVWQAAQQGDEAARGLVSWRSTRAKCKGVAARRLHSDYMESGAMILRP